MRFWIGALLFMVSACAAHHEDVRPNVILISLDTLRADHVGCYGYSRPTTPVIDALASRGVVFERAVANAPWTLPSHASMLTGLQPRHHGVRALDTALPETIPTLAGVLGHNGYQTMAIVNSRQLLPRNGLHRGFRQFEHFPSRKDGRRVRSGPQQIERAVELISQVHGRPFFLFLHNYDVHSDYDPSPRFAELFVRPYRGSIRGTSKDLQRVRNGEIALQAADLRHLVDLYDGGIREIDFVLGGLVDYLVDSGLVNHTFVILTSDHGEEFLEHGGVLHGRTMHRELLDVPLIISGPGLPKGRRVEHAVQPTDILATVLDLLELPPMTGLDGHSLVDAWIGKTDRMPDRRVYAEADHNREMGDDTLEMVQTDRYKLIFERPTEMVWLFDLDADSGEHVNIAADHPQIAAELLADLERRYEGRRSGVLSSELTNADREALRALGYID